MVSAIVAHWRKCSGAIHPSDAELLAANPAVFNLDYPPPAYVGDIDGAPIVLLNLNGGYDPEVTPTEFPNSQAIESAIKRLHYPSKVAPSEVAPYYAMQNYSAWIGEGRLAVVNAIAYRSPKKTRDVERIGRLLPSTTVHRKWLRDELLEEARLGKRLVVAHRYGLWGIEKRMPLPGVIFGTCPSSSNLSLIELNAVVEFLSKM